MNKDFPKDGFRPDDTHALRLITIVGSVLLVGLFIGYLVPKGPPVPIAIVGGFFLLALLFSRPFGFLILGLFVFYGSFNVFDLEVVGRVRGLFRLKDVILVLIVGYTLATCVLQVNFHNPVRYSKAAWIWTLLMAWFVLEYLYTVKIMGESPVLALRVGRTFLSYGWPFILLSLIKTDEQWKKLLTVLYVFGGITVFVAILQVMGIRLMLGGGASLLPKFSGSAFDFGIVRSGNPGESLIYALFMISFWMSVLKPTRKNILLALLFAVGSSLFLYRARIAGVCLGLFFTAFLVPAKARMRAALVVTIVLALVVLALLTSGALLQPASAANEEAYLSRIAEFFMSAAKDLMSPRGEDLYGRAFRARMRMPLIKEYPLMGIGYVSPFGGIAWGMFMRGHMPIGDVDVGWIDALIRLGGIGSFLLYFFLICVLFDARDVYRNVAKTPLEKSVALATVAFVILMFMTLYSFSYPTLETAIITFCILYSYVIHTRRKYSAPSADTAPAPPKEKRRHLESM